MAVTLVAAAGGAVLAAPAAAAGSRVPERQQLVVLVRDHVARTQPNLHSHRVVTVKARRPLTRLRTVLPVLGHATGKTGTRWLQVRLPGRPNGHKGWIPAFQTRRESTEWRLAVDLSARRVTIYRDGRVDRRFRAVVGKPSTPTPRGEFFIEEGLSLTPTDAGGPFALATSARSQVLQEFDGGPGQIALHGTGNLAGAPGTAVSHGCIRLSPAAITWLAQRIGRGVPLTIKR